MAIITINGNSLDPTSPTLSAFGLAQETAEGSGYILIQTNGPLTKEIKKELADKGVELHEKVSENTYLCGYKPEVRINGGLSFLLSLTSLCRTSPRSATCPT
jgi:hypothetical protein